MAASDPIQPQPQVQVLRELTRRIEEQATEIAELRRREEQSGSEKHRSGDGEQRGGEVAYRFDAGPKWMEESGWKDQSPSHRKAWPLLRRLLELERWTGAQVRVTYTQLADYLCISEDTVKPRTPDPAGELGAIDLRPGGGRRPTVITIKHPISTPLAYDEVPWAAGGLGEGIPPGYLQSLRGAKRHYAELYGVELSASEETGGDDAAGGETLVEEEPPVEKTGEHKADLAPPEGAHCPPSETGESCIIGSSLYQSDGESKTSSEEGKKKEQESNPNKDLERQIKEIPPRKIGSEGQLEALPLLEAMGRHDEVARARMAQAAHYLLSRGERAVLRTAAIRIGRARRETGTEVRDPLAYLVRVIQDVRQGAGELTPEERELAAQVAVGAAGNEGQGQGWDKRREEERRERWRGYEWVLGRPTGESPPGGAAKREGLGAEPTPEPWEGSPFGDIVPHEMWSQPVTPQIAGGIRRRIEELASRGDPEEYRRAREELAMSEWVGEPFVESVLGRCEKGGVSEP